MIPTKRDMEFWAHVSPNRSVWFRTATQQARDSELSPGDFIAQDWVRNSESIKVLGDRNNAELITGLWNAKVAQKLPLKIYLGSPTRSFSTMPEIATYAQLLTVPASCGGWHAMTSAEFPGYALIQTMAGNQETASPETRSLTQQQEQLLQAHPAYPVFSFLPQADLRFAAILLSFIVDPRWHIDSSRPDRLSPLFWYLGLGRPESSQLAWNAYIRQETEPVAVYRRVLLSVCSWAQPNMFLEIDDTRPEAVLQRIAAINDDRQRGILSATRTFVRWLRDVWLDRLTSPRIYLAATVNSRAKRHRQVRLLPSKSYSPQLFVPEHFFHEPEVAAVWKRHIRYVRDGRGSKNLED